MARVVVLGSSNTDMTVRLPRLPTPGETRLGGSFLTGMGGKGANQAVAASRAGAEVVFITAVGDDALGQQALDHYRRERIDIAHVLVVPNAPSGVALIFVSEVGENMIGVAPGANAQLTPAAIDRLPDSVFHAGGVLLAGLEVPLEAVARAVQRARQAGMTIILNPAPAPADLKLLSAEILPFVDLLTPNQVEACDLTGLPAATAQEWNRSRDLAWSATEPLRAKGVREVIITNGKEGCLVVAQGTAPPDAPVRSIPAFPVVTVDTVGAGDAFNGALATAIAEGRPLFEAAVWASAAAALAVTQPGAQTALARRDAIDRLAATFPADGD